jgi:hypothetical protein
MSTLAWIDQSQGALTPADVALIVAALNVQAPQFSAAWKIATYEHVVATAASVPANADKAYFLPNADVAGALGYHDTDPQGDPYIRVFTDTILQNGGTKTTGALSISVCASHEACELAADPGCTSVATDGQGRQWALEVCDPVENDSYPVTANGEQVAVSDFVTPAFFATAGKAPYDYTSSVGAPFTLAKGGYAIINGGQVFGDEYPEWRKKDKQSPVSRTWRRIHHL